MSKIIKSKYVISSNNFVSLCDSKSKSEESDTGASPELNSEGYKRAAFYDEKGLQELIRKETLKAKEEGDKIISQAVDRSHAEGEKIIRKAMEEAEEIKKQAFDKGFLEASAEKAREINECIEKINTFILELKYLNEKHTEEYDNNLKWLAIDITEKILAKKIKSDDGEMNNLVKQAVESVKNASWISVSISEEMPKLLDFLETELIKASDSGSVKTSVNAKDIPMGSCVIETSEGILDASIQTQLQNVREYFRQSEATQ